MFKHFITKEANKFIDAEYKKFDQPGTYTFGDVGHAEKPKHHHGGASAHFEGRHHPRHHGKHGDDEIFEEEMPKQDNTTIEIPPSHRGRFLKDGNDITDKIIKPHVPNGGKVLKGMRPEDEEEQDINININFGGFERRGPRKGKHHCEIDFTGMNK